MLALFCFCLAFISLNVSKPEKSIQKETLYTTENVKDQTVSCNKCYSHCLSNKLPSLLCTEMWFGRQDMLFIMMFYYFVLQLNGCSNEWAVQGQTNETLNCQNKNMRQLILFYNSCNTWILKQYKWWGKFIESVTAFCM